MLVVYGPMARLSVGKLFMAAVIPGVLLGFLYMAYVFIRCLLEPNLAPTVPAEQRKAPLAYKLRLLLISLVPPLFIILSVLGTIFFGIAPPTEASAVGALASFVMVIAYRKMNWKNLKDILLRTLNITAMAYFIAVMSVGYTGVFLRSGAGEVVQATVLATPGGAWGVFLVVMLIYFILGFFIEWIGIFFIMVPLLAPLAPMLGFDPIWFGTMIAINLQMSFLTPPYAFTIFVMRAAAPPELGLETMDIIRGIIPYVILIIVGLLLCVAFPELILWLPRVMIE
jgi:tripartite ATP-independent transporter DctM subunit